MYHNGTGKALVIYLLGLAYISHCLERVDIVVYFGTDIKLPELMILKGNL